MFMEEMNSNKFEKLQIYILIDLPIFYVLAEEREKTPEKAEPPSRVIQKTKPKSKWADISKQIEQNAAKTPKPVTKNIQSKLSAAGKIIL